jgi:hypothetical protein
MRLLSPSEYSKIIDLALNGVAVFIWDLLREMIVIIWDFLYEITVRIREKNLCSELVC